MTQGITPNGIITLTPDPGMGITNGDIIADSIVYLGRLDSPANWRDCPLEPVPPAPVEDEADTEDYQAALRALGVNAHD